MAVGLAYWYRAPTVVVNTAFIVGKIT